MRKRCERVGIWVPRLRFGFGVSTVSVGLWVPRMRVGLLVPKMRVVCGYPGCAWNMGTQDARGVWVPRMRVGLRVPRMRVREEDEGRTTSDISP